MRVIKPRTIHDWGKAHPTADTTLRHWRKVTEQATWHTIADARRSFPHADPVAVKSGNTVTVFNIGSFRLVTAIIYRSFTVYALRFMTHAEYEKGNAHPPATGKGSWKNTL